MLEKLMQKIAVATKKDFSFIDKNKKQFNPDNSWELVFEDDFETLDWTKWKSYCPKNGVRNAAYYTDDEDIIFVKDGCLYIRTKWKNGKYGEGYYTSWIESSVNKSTDKTINLAKENYEGFSTTYGYFEIRCKFPPAKGIWSAFWLMPDNNIAFSDDDEQGTGRDGAEIDIYESPFYSMKPRNCVQSAAHCDGYDERLKSDASKVYCIDDPYSEFHTYALEWNEKEYIFYVDGYETWRTSHLHETAKVDEYMILSVEVGGANDGQKPTSYKFWCGDSSKNDKSKQYDFVVDYVRVYKKKA